VKVLVDMNLSPDWVPQLARHGWETRHWSELGPANAPDTSLLEWARAHSHIVLTQDLDFPQLLFATGVNGPSVILLRMHDEFDQSARQHVFAAIQQAEAALDVGALLTISDNRVRLRRLPIVP
jgi:predicted nuclease of predicted toxin-antitoxin system